MNQKDDLHIENAKRNDCSSWDRSMLKALFNAGALSVINNDEVIIGQGISASVAAACRELDTNLIHSASVVARNFARGCRASRKDLDHTVFPFISWCTGFAIGLGDKL